MSTPPQQPAPPSCTGPDACEACPEGQRRLALRLVTLPKDTNQYGTIFGGVILSHIDQAGFVEARQHGLHRWVTASIDRVDFTHPVYLGDTVNLHTCTMRTGRSSVTVRVEVEAERYSNSAVIPVTTAQLTMVAIDQHGRPIDFRSKPTVHLEPDTDDSPGNDSASARV